MDISDYMKLFKPNPTGPPQQNDAELNSAMANSRANAQSGQAQVNQAQGGAIRDLYDYFKQRPGDGPGPTGVPLPQGRSYGPTIDVSAPGSGYGSVSATDAFAQSNPMAAANLGQTGGKQWLTALNNTQPAASAATGAAAAGTAGTAIGTVDAAATSGETGAAFQQLLGAIGSVFGI